MALKWVNIGAGYSASPYGLAPYNVTVPAAAAGETWTKRIKLVVSTNTWSAPGANAQHLWFKSKASAANGWPQPGEYTTTVHSLDSANGGVVEGFIGYDGARTMQGVALFKCYAEAEFEGASGEHAIIFEPFAGGTGEDTESVVEAFVPRASAFLFAGFGDFSGVIMASAPRATAEFSGGAVPGDIAPPAYNQIFANAPRATADFLVGTSAGIYANAPRATALLTQWENFIMARAPRAFAQLGQTDLDAGFIAAYRSAIPYVSIWSGHWDVGLEDSLVLGDTTTSSFIVQLRERLNIAGTHKSILHTAIALQDTLILQDAVQIIWQVVLDEAMVLADSGQATRTLVANLLDRLVLADVAATTLDARVTLATVLALADSVGVFWLAELVETLDVSDALDVRVTALVALLEQLELDADSAMTFTAVANINESLLLADEGGTQLDANVALHEALELFGSITINGDVWSCWLINTESKGVARYTNYPFNSFAKAPWGGYVGATDTGLHMLDGDTDDGEPIHALIRSALTDFGSRHLKRVPNIYLGYTATGPLVLKVVHTSEQGRKVEDWYRVEPREADSVRESRFKVGRGVASVYLGFELVNVGGADFALDVVEWLPMRLDRRVR